MAAVAASAGAASGSADSSWAGASAGSAAGVAVRAAARRASRSAWARAASLRASVWRAMNASSSSTERTTGTLPGSRLAAMKRPSSTASAMTRASSELARMASSLPGIGYCTSSGSTLVSTTATTGMPSLLASVTAMCSFLVSSTNTASGRLVRPRRPPRLRCSFSISRVSRRASFFGIASNSPESRIRSYSSILPTRLEMVSKFVSMPPSQRSLTNGMPHFSA